MPNTLHFPHAPVPSGETIRRYRKAAGMTQEDLADRMNVSRNTVVNWESGKCHPDWEIARKLCQCLRIPAHELLGLPMPEAVSAPDAALLRRFHQLSETGQRTVSRMVKVILQEEEAARRRDLKSRFRLVDLYSTPAAAGAGCPFEEETAEYRFMRRDGAAARADALIRVSGRSMEPVYHSGDLVLIRYANRAEAGQDVVCSTADGAVIKRVGKQGLFSLNDNFPFGDHYEDDEVRVLGVVLGIAQEADFAAPEETEELESALDEEVADFRRRTGQADAQ